MKYTFDEKNHLHLLDGKPLTGTSSVEDVLGKVLTWWASGKAVETLGWVYPKIKRNGKIIGEIPKEDRIKAAEAVLASIKQDTPERYLQRLDDAYKAHSVFLKNSASAGTDLHAELEDFVKGQMGLKPVGKYDPKINPFIEWSKENVKKFLWSEAHCFDETFWVGGISDCGVELNSGILAVIDFKSAKESYPNHFIQGAGYAIQIDNNGLWDKNGKVNKKLEGKIGALIVVPFGAETIKPEVRYDVDAYKKGFEWCVGLYRLLGYNKNV